MPIYKGAPNVKSDFLPCDHCVIEVDDYPTSSRLGAYLMYLINNRTAYEEYFAWKRSPRLDAIERLARYGLDTAICCWTDPAPLTF